LAVSTPNLGLKKPVPDVEIDWAFRLNESLDTLDGCLLTGSAISGTNMEIFDDGNGNVTFSLNDNPTLVTITATVGTFTSSVSAPTIDTDNITATEDGDFGWDVTVGGGLTVSGTTAIDGTHVVTTSGVFDEVFVGGAPWTNILADASFRLLFHVRDSKTASTTGGSFTAGPYQTRDLNSEVTNRIPGASLSANQITLPAGNYYAEFTAPAFDVGRHKAYFYSVTSAAVLIQGTSEYTDTTYNGTSTSQGGGQFTLAVEEVIEIRHRCAITRTSNGYGVESSQDSFPEIYTDVRIWDIGASAQLVDNITVTSGTFTERLNVPTVSGVSDGDVWVDTTTSGLRWLYGGTVFEVQGTEVV